MVLKHKKSYLIIFIFIFSLLNTKAFSEGYYRSYGDNESKRYSSLNKINKSNVKNLKNVWEFKFNLKKKFGRKVNQLTPIFVNNKIVTASLDNYVIALNPKTGKVIWKNNFGSNIGSRGFTSFKYKKKFIIVVPSSKGILFIKSKDGKLEKSLGDNGLFKYPTTKGVNSVIPPIVTNEKLFVGTNTDGIIAYDILNGQIIWKRSFKSGNVTARIWSGLSYDKMSNSLFVVTSNPDDLIGTDREFEIDYSCSLISVNAKNGEINWYFQETKHDLWDFDLAGSPIISDVMINEKKRTVVIGLSKTGQIIYLDSLTGKPIFKKSITKINVPLSDLKNEKSSKTQIQILKPKRVSSISLDPNNDIRISNVKYQEYLKMKTRWANYEHYAPPSLNYDALMMGLHGGVNRSGGTLIKEKEQLVVSTNHETWILRLFYYDRIYTTLNRIILFFDGILSDIFNYKPSYQAINILRWEEKKEPKIVDKIYSYIPIIGNNDSYNQKCSSCHGSAGQGFIETETYGDTFYPPITGISMTKKFSSLNNINTLKNLHLDNVLNPLKQSEFENIKSFIINRDNFLNKVGVLNVFGRWQLLHGLDKMPINKPPWGKITSIDLKTGEHDWSIPFGTVTNNDNEVLGEGALNFGGLLSTSSNLLFATGTTDKKHYAYDLSDGKTLWSYQGNLSGSTSPMTYQYQNCQYVIFVETGGSFVGFKNGSGSIKAFALPNCKL
jgi:quinoprotein glucose dehydrogenase